MRTLVALAGVTLVLASVTATGAAAQPQPPDLELGAELYLRGCASCHGADGGGVETPEGAFRGPSIQNSGAAGAFYYLATGRMPLANTGEQPVRKEPAYTPSEIDALVAYVAQLGDGPPVPEVSLVGADVAHGGEIYRANCQACHSAFGSGGALSYGRAAPNLRQAKPTEVAAAVRVGPGQMPAFGPDQITDDELDDLAAYVEYLKDPEDPGGLPIGRNGPVPEGFVAWLFGIGALLVVVAWIGGRDPGRTEHE